MEVIEQIGSYAGFAAVVGLAVLAALYFSQARDVRRLREWAGRAPERMAPPAGQARQVVGRPVPRPPGAQPGAPYPTQPGRAPGSAAPAGSHPPPPSSGTPPAGTSGPGGIPAPARPATAGAGPAVVASPAAATPAARAGTAGPGTVAEDGERGLSDDTVVHPPPGRPPTEAGAAGAPLGSEGSRGGTGPEVDEPGSSEAGEPPDGEPGLEPGPEPLEDERDQQGDADGYADEGFDDGERRGADLAWSPRPGAPAPATSAAAQRLPATGAVRAAPPPPVGARGGTTPSGPILPPYARSRPGAESWETRSIPPRRAALMIGAVVLVLAAVTLGVMRLAQGGDERAEPAAQRAETAGQTAGSAGGGGDQGGDGARPRAAIAPGEVTVAVLNGTTVTGLAADVGDTVSSEGFQLGNITNSTDQQRAESVVLYARGADREAAEVARRLDITQREEIDPESQGLAGDASVVVVVGQDKAE